MEIIEETVPDPTCPNCGLYLSGPVCDKCGLDLSNTDDLAEVEIYKLFRKWRGKRKRVLVTDAWRAGYEAGRNAADHASALQAAQDRVRVLEEALRKYVGVRDGFGKISANLALGLPCDHDFYCHNPDDQDNGCLHDTEGRMKHPCKHCGKTRAALNREARNG